LRKIIEIIETAFQEKHHIEASKLGSKPQSELQQSSSQKKYAKTVNISVKK